MRTQIALGIATAWLLALVLATFASAANAQQVVGEFPAETMSLRGSAGQVFNDPSAERGKALLIWSNATATKYVNLSGPADRIAVRAKGDQCNGSPLMTVRVDGQKVLQRWVWQTKYTDYVAALNLPAGLHKIQVTMGHDYSTQYCDRNLRVDKITLTGLAATEPDPEPALSGNPLAGETFYLDPYSQAANSGIQKIASQPIAGWFGDWNGDIRADVSRYVTAAKNNGALPVLVAYNIPIRDCGSYSSGGAPSAEAYKSWIDAYAAGIGSRKAVVILEPDALALTDCLNDVQRQERYDLLGYAVEVLKAQGAVVYLDAGHSNWIGASEMAGRLSKANVAAARGFATNVSNFERTADLITYSKEISAALGGKGFVIDTGRNGNGPGDTWCNPDGRALGERPTASTGTAADAYLWIKPPGESDGTCNGGPPAGHWWHEYALGLAQRAAY